MGIKPHLSRAVLIVICRGIAGYRVLPNDVRGW